MTSKKLSNLAYIYKITSPEGKIYIGQTINLKKRLVRYKYLDCKTQHKIYESIVKHGWEAHIVEVLYTLDKAVEDIDELEKFYIKKFNSHYYANRPFGLNLTKGGKGLPRGKSVVKRIQKSRKGYKHSEETRKKLSKSNKGQIPWCKGKKFTKEHINKIVQTKRATGGYDRIISEEQRLKQSLSMKGKVFDDKWRENISKSAKNRKSQGGNKKIISYNSNNSFFKEYESMGNALISLGLKPNPQRLREAIVNNELYHNKYWKYASKSN